jgi:hypothetical protein
MALSSVSVASISDDKAPGTRMRAVIWRPRRGREQRHLNHDAESPFKFKLRLRKLSALIT